MRELKPDEIEQVSGGEALDWNSGGLAVIGLGFAGGPATALFGLGVGGGMLVVGYFSSNK